MDPFQYKNYTVISLVFLLNTGEADGISATGQANLPSATTGCELGRAVSVLQVYVTDFSSPSRPIPPHLCCILPELGRPKRSPEEHFPTQLYCRVTSERNVDSAAGLSRQTFSFHGSRGSQTTIIHEKPPR